MLAYNKKSKKKSKNQLDLGKKILLVIVVLILSFFVLVLGYIAAWEIEAMGYVPYIQRAINEQCNRDDIIVSTEGYSGDPMPNWGSPEAFCYHDISTDEFLCSCYEVP